MRRSRVEKKDLFRYIGLRLIVITTVLISAVIIQFSGAAGIPIMPLFYLLLTVYFLSGIYLILYSFGKRYTAQAYIQVVFDLMLITAFVYISGGAATSTYFLYIFVIIGAGLVISPRAAFLAASLAAILFGILVDGMYFGFLPYFNPEQAADLSLGTILFNMFVAWSAFFAIAALMNSLSSNLRKTRQALHRAQKELAIQERLAETGRISAILAHEIRNPLAAISGSIQVLKNELALKKEQGELMDIVLKESVRISQSLEQFLDFAHPIKTVFTRINLTELLDEILIMLRQNGELNGSVVLNGNFREAEVHFFGNAGQFKQIYWNLIKNAIKAMPRGGTLTMNFQEEKERVRISFLDTGRGMSDDDKAHLFEPFYSGFESGRGLGMAGVRRIVDDYEGVIEVRSELGKGTEIRISFPATGRGYDERARHRAA